MCSYSFINYVLLLVQGRWLIFKLFDVLKLEMLKFKLYNVSTYYNAVMFSHLFDCNQQLNSLLNFL